MDAKKDQRTAIKFCGLLAILGNIDKRTEKLVKEANKESAIES